MSVCPPFTGCGINPRSEIPKGSLRKKGGPWGGQVNADCMLQSFSHLRHTCPCSSPTGYFCSTRQACTPRLSPFHLQQCWPRIVSLTRTVGTCSGASKPALRRQNKGKNILIGIVCLILPPWQISSYQWFNCQLAKILDI